MNIPAGFCYPEIPKREALDRVPPCSVLRSHSVFKYVYGGGIVLFTGLENGVREAGVIDGVRHALGFHANRAVSVLLDRKSVV